jgi:tetraacyldisaccharide 4'-kinase
VARAGDEPVMLARRVPGAVVIVSDVRAIGAALAESALGATVHLLDDGFQHRSIARDINLVLITPNDLLDRRVPFGRLRSSVRTLASADAVIVDEGEASEVDARLRAIVDRRRTQVFVLERRLGQPRWLETPPGTLADGNLPPGVTVLVAAGIARPERFAESLRAHGFGVADTIRFPDHHVFSRADLDRVRAALHRTGATAVATTEKDAIRWLPLRPLGLPMVAVPLEVAVQPEAAFTTWLLTRLGEVRACKH